VNSGNVLLGELDPEASDLDLSEALDDLCLSHFLLGRRIRRLRRSDTSRARPFAQDWHMRHHLVVTNSAALVTWVAAVEHNSPQPPKSFSAERVLEPH